MFQSNRGFTLIELMITIIVVGVGVALAVPTWQAAVEKRQVVSAAEEIVSLLNFSQSEAVKRNQVTTVSWNSPGGHNKNWCMGAILGATACDCTETVTTELDYCDIGGTPYRLVQADFAGINDEFMHINTAVEISNLSFDPIRGILTNVPGALAAEIGAGDKLLHLHSPSFSGGSRYYELEVRITMTGRTSICTDDGRQRTIGGYPVCP